MRGGAERVIISAMDDDREHRAPPSRGADSAARPDYTAPVSLAVCGEPVVGRTLVLLLQGPRYDARFLDASALSEPGALEGVRVVLLTPSFSSTWREVLAAALEDAPGGGARIAVLKLAATPEETVGPEHEVPWPCSTAELKRRIEAALLAGSGGKPPAGAR